MKLKRTCRTCANLYPTTYDGGHDEGYYYEDIYPSNCEYEDCSEDVDAPTECEYYKPISLDKILEDE